MFYKINNKNINSHDKVLEGLTICHENLMLSVAPPGDKYHKQHAVLPVGPSRFDPLIEGLRSNDTTQTGYFFVEVHTKY